jgi:TIR domain
MRDRPIRVFVSYAHDDSRHLEQFRAHTAVLRRNNQVEIFDDQGIGAGQRWRPTLTRKLEEADIVVAFVTAKFVESEFCYCIEFRRALERESSGACTIIPVNVGPVDLGPDDPLSAIQHVPQGQPISERGSRKASAWKQVAKALRMRVNELQSNTVGSCEVISGAFPDNVIPFAARKVGTVPSKPSVHQTRSRHAPDDDNATTNSAVLDGWKSLAEVLRVTQFDGTDRRSLAMSTGQLRECLRRVRPDYGQLPDRAREVAEELQRTLTNALSPTENPTRIRAACTHSERLRDWLLDMLTSSEK